MIDEDTILTEEDYKALQECEKEEAEGKLIPLEQAKKKLGLLPKK
ncbi:MAG: hypothetical protein OEV42_20320 [Deltaproteobacteria bacterium]|nr:hypothetical protein [Deltaproteobacteria bacterium]